MKPICFNIREMFYGSLHREIAKNIFIHPLILLDNCEWVIFNTNFHQDILSFNNNLIPLYYER